MTRVYFYKSAMNNMLLSPEGEVGRYLSKKGRNIVRAAKRQVGVKTGALRASIHMRHYRDSRGQWLWIGSDTVDHALMHHEGTRPHPIPVGRDQFRRFTKRSSMMYLDIVDHPGTKANKYLSDKLRLVK